MYCKGNCPGSGKKFSWISGYENPGHRDDLAPFCDLVPHSSQFKLALQTTRKQFSVYEVLNKDGTRRAPFQIENQKFYKGVAGGAASAATADDTPKVVSDTTSTGSEEEIDIDAIDEYDI